MSRTTEGPVILETDAGPIQFTIIRSARRKKTLELRVEPGGVVVVAAPLRASTADIERFVRARTEWVRDRIDTSGAGPDTSLEDGSEIPFRGQSLVLEVRRGSTKSPRVDRDGDLLRVTTPAGDGGDEHVRPAVERWLREQARQLVSTRVVERAAEMAVTPAGVRIANQKRRWGSCSPTGVLRFNWRLAMVADEVLDYVVVHELAHLRHMNHSKEFWDFVALFVPDHMELKRQLRTAGAGWAL